MQHFDYQHPDRSFYRPSALSERSVLGVLFHQPTSSEGFQSWIRSCCHDSILSSCCSDIISFLEKRYLFLELANCVWIHRLPFKTFFHLYSIS